MGMRAEDGRVAQRRKRDGRRLFAEGEPHRVGRGALTTATFHFARLGAETARTAYGLHDNARDQRGGARCAAAWKRGRGPED